MAESITDHNNWLYQIQARIVTGSFLMEDIKTIASSGQSSAVHKLRESLMPLFLPSQTIVSMSLPHFTS